ncbi:hypothetical protein SMC26_27505 [Actinomadura fulvescens]|uniref:GTA TIM-barrel-like domain-containing protein n=1 Tax=Actinomadura fulvescens TaxID=46160 RepID=A0ABN3PTS2_9ACTN
MADRERGRLTGLLIILGIVAACSASGGGSGKRSHEPGSRQTGGTDVGGGTHVGGGERRGIALPSWNTDDYASPAARSYVEAIAATGARWIQLNPTWYQDSPKAADLRATEETASDASLRHIIGLARRAGLKVLLKPHVNLPGDQDRSAIRPRRHDRARWYAAYTRFVVHYADLARETGVAELAVGTELAGMSGDRSGWLAVVRSVRARFHGPLVYAANYDEFEDVAFWDAVDLIGIDAYWPLAPRPTTDVAALRRAWSPILDKVGRFAAERQRPVLFTEAGYVSQRGTTTEPYAWELSATNGNAEQAAAYEALLASCAGRRWWAGVHWWMWDDWPDAAETPPHLAYSPHGKPAEQVLRRWWRPK